MSARTKAEIQARNDALAAECIRLQEDEGIGVTEAARRLGITANQMHMALMSYRARCVIHEPLATKQARQIDRAVAYTSEEKARRAEAKRAALERLSRPYAEQQRKDL